MIQRAALLFALLLNLQGIQSQHLWMSLEQFRAQCEHLDGYTVQLVEKSLEGFQAFVLDSQGKAFHIQLLPLKNLRPSTDFGQTININGMPAVYTETQIVSKVVVYNVNYLAEIQIVTSGNLLKKDLTALAKQMEMRHVQLPCLSWPEEIPPAFRPDGEVLWMHSVSSGVEGFTKYLEVYIVDDERFRQSLLKLKTAHESSDDFIAFPGLLMLVEGKKLSSFNEAESDNWPLKLKYYIR